MGVRWYRYNQGAERAEGEKACVSGLWGGGGRSFLRGFTSQFDVAFRASTAAESGGSDWCRFFSPLKGFVSFASFEGVHLSPSAPGQTPMSAPVEAAPQGDGAVGESRTIRQL